MADVAGLRFWSGRLIKDVVSRMYVNNLTAPDRAVGYQKIPDRVGNDKKEFFDILETKELLQEWQNVAICGEKKH